MSANRIGLLVGLFALHMSAVALVWVPMYDTLTERIGLYSSTAAMATGVGAVAAFILMARLERASYVFWLLPLAEGLLAVIYVAVRGAISAKIVESQLLFLLFVACGLCQSACFSLYTTIFLQTLGKRAFRSRAAGTIGFLGGTIAIVLKVTHFHAMEAASYIFLLCACGLFVIIKTVTPLNPVTPENERPTRGLANETKLILAIALAIAAIENIYSQEIFGFVTNAIPNGDGLYFLAIMLVLEFFLVLAAAERATEYTWVITGTIAWLFVFGGGFIAGQPVFTIGAAFNCGLGYSLAMLLQRRDQRASAMALLFAVSAIGGQIGSIALMVSKATVGQIYAIYFAIIVCALAFSILVFARQRLDPKTISES